MDRDRENTETRITNLESALAHHQHEYDVLNQVVVQQADTIEKLTRKLVQLEASLRSVQQSLPDDRDPIEEKPPHY